MVLQRITNDRHPMYPEALKLYRSSFPYHEQREQPSQDAILQNDQYHFCLVYDEQTFVGLILYWEQEAFRYIEHFCILPEMRNRQYGQKTLSLLQEDGKNLILEIDPPENEIARRRKGFYERCGFVENGFSHTHPPYHKENQGHPLMIMTYPRQISQDVFDSFGDYLNHQVMHQVF